MCFICQDFLLIYASLNCLGNKKIMRLFLKKIMAHDLVKKVSMHMCAYCLLDKTCINSPLSIYNFHQSLLTEKENESVLTNLIFIISL